MSGKAPGHVSRFFRPCPCPARPFSLRAQSKMSAAAFSLSARAAVATRVTAPVQQRRGTCLPSRLPPRALPDPHAWKNPGDRLGRVSGLGFVLPAPERVPGTPREPRTTPNAFASSGTRLPWTAGGQFGPGGRASGHPVAVGVAVFPESDVPHQWITYRRAMVFLSAARRRGEARLSPLLTVSDPPRFRPPPFAWKQPPPSRPKPARR